LTLIDNQIDPSTGTAKFKAIFKNAHDRLWPGQFVNARVLVRVDKRAMTIPSTAVQLGANGPFTYVVKDDSTVEARPLTLGQENNGMTIVTHGLDPADRVVTSNQYRLQAGAHVQANSPAPRAT
jgi:multidrug efflux system membrane fusion protein